jgi:hypothetical protein
LTKRKAVRPWLPQAGAMFNEAPMLTPVQALMTGGAVIVGGIVIFALLLVVTRWLATR